ncbi:hypothetical protein BJ994_001218 [Arthrobacter pigmenti]|uniref:DUF3159 domain-containing protein n=2 Tax=Arthrobacter pigmenti TaxID=271432 RepID=A0A846RNE7_9MICC|nr:hypothetical protein [Arthrobacter pigmenti]
MNEPAKDRTHPADNEVPAADAAGAESGMGAFANQYAAKAGVRQDASGRIDVLQSIGGVRGLAESILPGLLFTIVFTVSRDLSLSLIVALAVAAVFTVVRLFSRTPLTQALSGLVGVAICAFVANQTGNAEDFFLPGFITNAAYIVGMVISIAIRWPLAGLLFGFIRGEGTDWRKNASRVRAYVLATWLIVAVLALRLIVQVPLYLADNIAALGATRVAMGVPLYALGLWFAWLVSRPAAQKEQDPPA